jgi:hypothetical protein
MIPVLDALAILAALLSSWFWFKASQSRVRRIQRNEDIDAADLNRIVVAINRSQVLNARAAFVTAISALIVALRFGVLLIAEDL